MNKKESLGRFNNLKMKSSWGREEISISPEERQELLYNPNSETLSMGDYSSLDYDQNHHYYPYLVNLHLIARNGKDGWYFVEYALDDEFSSEEPVVCGGPFKSMEELEQAVDEHLKQYSANDEDLEKAIKKYEKDAAFDRADYDRYVEEQRCLVKKEVFELSQQGLSALWNKLSSFHLWDDEERQKEVAVAILKELGRDVAPENLWVIPDEIRDDNNWFTKSIIEMPKNLSEISTPGPVSIDLGEYIYETGGRHKLPQRVIGQTEFGSGRGPLILVRGEFFPERRFHNEQGLTQYDVYGAEGSWFTLKDSVRNGGYKFVSSTEKTYKKKAK